MVASSVFGVQSDLSLEDEAQIARFSLLGHDLRAAVSDVLGGLRLVPHQGLSEAAEQQLERVRAAAEEMARLLEDGIMLAAEHSGAAAIRPVSTARFLHEIELRWAGRAQEKHLSFSVETAPDVPPIVILERNAVERVLANLLSNGLKYTERGAVILRVGLAPGGMLRFAVHDDGPGFAPGVVEHLFHAGVRGEAGRNHPGHGLGLFIARQIAERMGGRIEAGNRPEGGGCVALLLPEHHPAAEPRAEPADLPDLSHMRVLLADDSRVNQMVLGQMLSAMGADHDIAADGVEALDMLEAGAYDLAILDVEMPRMSGLQVMRTLRAGGDRQAAIPVIACTAYALRSNRDAILAAGGDVIVSKPVVSAAPLAGAIRQALALRGTDVGTLSAQEHPETRLAVAPSLTGLLAGSDAASMTPFLEQFLADLVEIERGLAAARAVPDLERIRTEAHKLVSVAGTLGEAELHSGAELLHRLASDGRKAEVRQEAGQLLTRLDRIIHLVSGQLHAVAGEGA